MRISSLDVRGLEGKRRGVKTSVIVLVTWGKEKRQSNDDLKG